MPKKTKKGGGKSEEERLLQLQQRAQAEEEMAKKKEETLTLFLKDKLQKEQRNSVVNLLKLNDRWRTILRQTRVVELRTDWAVLQQTFERQLDNQDSVVKKLLQELQEAERQEAQMQHSHLQHVERLQAQQDKQLRALQQWKDSLLHLNSTFRSDRKQMLFEFQQQQVKLEDLMLSAEQSNEDAMDEIKRLYDERLMLYTNTHNEKIIALKDTLGLQYSKDWQSLWDREGRHLGFQTFVEEETINNATENVRGLQDTVKQMREKPICRTMEIKAQEEDLTVARNEVNQKCNEIQDWLIKRQAALRKQLTVLSIQGHNTAKKLQAVISKSQTVLRVADICCKLENKYKIFLQPSPLCQPSENHPQVRSTAAKEPCEFVELQQLMSCLNTALLHREALKRRRHDLSRENVQLKLLLCQYEEDNTLDEHSMLIASQAPTTTIPPAADRRRTVVIEAVHAMKYSL